MKGISERVKTILMIAIVISIIGIASYFLFGFLFEYMAKSVEKTKEEIKHFFVVPLDHKCDVSDNKIDLVLVAKGDKIGKLGIDFNVSTKSVDSTITYYSGAKCFDVDNIGNTNCEKVLGFGSIVNPGEYIGVRILGAKPNTFVAGKDYEIRIFSIGRFQSIFVSC